MFLSNQLYCCGVIIDYMSMVVIYLNEHWIIGGNVPGRRLPSLKTNKDSERKTMLFLDLIRVQFLCDLWAWTWRNPNNIFHNSWQNKKSLFIIRWIFRIVTKYYENYKSHCLLETERKIKSEWWSVRKIIVLIWFLLIPQFSNVTL